MKNKLKEIFSKKWTLFIIVSIIYLSLSASASVSRYANLETVIGMHGDYYIHTRYTAVIASGVSPYSSRQYFYKTSGFIPIQHCEYAAYNTVNAIIMKFSSLGAEEVVYVLSPFLFNVALVLSIFIASKILRFSPIQATAFLVLHNFINDPNAIFTPAHSMGETLGNALGIIGVALFLQQKTVELKKIRSYIIVPLLGIAVWLHLCNLAFIVVLTLFTLLCVILSLITKKEYSHNYKHFVFLGLSGLLVVPYMIPMFTPVESEWIIPYTDVGENVVDPIKNPPPYPEKPINKTEPVDSIEPVEITETETNIIQFVLTPVGFPYYPTYYKYQEWLYPSTIPEFLLTFGYPFGWIYFGSTARATLDKIMVFVGYNLTNEEVENLINLNSNSSIMPAICALTYNIGIPLIFVATLVICLKEKNKNSSLLFLSSYLLIIGISLFFLVFGFTFFSNRFIRYTALFWVIILSMGLTRNSKFIYPLFIVRSILWILAFSFAGGL